MNHDYAMQRGRKAGASLRLVIASDCARAYLQPMVARSLLRVLTMLALLFAPLSMMGGHAAMAMPGAGAMASMHAEATGSSSHCAEMNGQATPGDQSSPSSCCQTGCVVMCAAIPGLGSVMADRPLTPALAEPLALSSRVRGLHPELADPPPRIV